MHRENGYLISMETVKMEKNVSCNIVHHAECKITCKLTVYIRKCTFHFDKFELWQTVICLGVYPPKIKTIVGVNGIHVSIYNEAGYLVAMSTAKLDKFAKTMWDHILWLPEPSTSQNMDFVGMLYQLLQLIL